MDFTRVLAVCLCLLNARALSTRAQIGLRVSPEQSVVNHPARQQFVVTCQGFGAEPNLFSDFHWFDKRGEEITKFYSQKVNPDIRVQEVVLGQLLLHFLNPTEDQSGEYRCSATFQSSDTFSAKISVNFFQDVQWEDCPSPQALIFGQSNERIRCKASANPKPNIVWSKDEKPLDGSKFQIDSEGVAINDVIDDSYGGVYRVRALVTETGRLHDNYVTVQVLRKPEVVSLPERFEAIEDLEAKIECTARGRPQPLFTWLDSHQRNLSSLGGYFVDRTSGSLIIARVRKVEDSGRFTCVAENAAGSDRKSTLLVVTRRPRVTSFLNVSYEVNRESELECRTIGDPKPLITIRRDGDSRALQNGDPRVTLDSFEEKEETVLKLRINPTARADDGLYFCRAENNGGVAEAVGHLEVRFAPDMRRTPTTTVKHWDLNPINITCIADAIPNATIRWYFRGLELNSANVKGYTIEDRTGGVSRLHIDARTTQRDIYGQYRCHSMNALGENEIRIQLDQAFRPGAVLQSSAERISPKVILFRVLAPSFDGGMPIKAIHVHYRAEDSGSADPVMTRKWPVDQKADGLYLLDGLKPRTRYSFRFAAENEIGISDFSQERIVWTEREKRPEKPEFRNIGLQEGKEVVSQYSNQFSVSWTLPEDNGRPIQFFEIKCYKVRKTEFGFERISGEEERLYTLSMSDQSMTSFTFRDLKPNSFFKIEIRAKNEFGFSEVSELVFRTTDKTTDDDTDDPNVSSAGLPLALIAGLALAAIVALLVLTDVFFFCRFRVGVIYFLSSHVFAGDNDDTRMATTKTTLSTTPERRLRDDQNEPFFGRASAV